jgi:hypothetical protein
MHTLAVVVGAVLGIWMLASVIYVSATRLREPDSRPGPEWSSPADDGERGTESEPDTHLPAVGLSEWLDPERD